MKKINKIFAIILLSILLIIAGITSVSAKDENDVNIWKTTSLDGGKKLSASVDVINENSTEIVFRVNLPHGEKMATLRGDVDQNGKVDKADDELLNKILAGSINFSNDVSKIAADAFIDGKNDSQDSSAILSKISYMDQAIEIKGTLANKVIKSEFVRNSVNDGTYLVKITLPQNVSGTIGFKLNEGTLKYDYFKTNTNIEKVINFPTEVSIDPVQSSPNKPIEKDVNMSIADGKRNENKITFKIIAPKGTGLVGDVNNDGKVSEEDANLILSYITGKINDRDINTILADADNNSKISVSDSVLLNKDYIGKLNNFISLTGTLAEKSTFELVKTSDGTYSVVVTIPEDTKSGTIGVVAKANLFKTIDSFVNKEMKSNLFSINENSDNDDNNNSGNGNIDNNEDNNSDNTNNDSTVAKSVIPQTGMKYTVFASFVFAVISAVVSIIKQRKINKRLYLR